MALSSKTYTKVRVRIEAATREQLALAAKEMQVELIRVRQLNGIKSGFLGIGTRTVLVK